MQPNVVNVTKPNLSQQQQQQQHHFVHGIPVPPPPLPPQNRPLTFPTTTPTTQNRPLTVTTLTTMTTFPTQNALLNLKKLQKFPNQKGWTCQPSAFFYRLLMSDFLYTDRCSRMMS
ncbi:MAG: hypothetical protein H0X30_25310 [Anaerolineae bacterium]|nr:hypothetical protein [Anaerolineae bacterium]